MTVGLLSEDFFHKGVRYLYSRLTFNQVLFGLPKLDFPTPSLSFIIFCGLLGGFAFYLLQRQTTRQRVFNSVSFCILFCVVVIIYSYFDALADIAACTACDDGIVVLDYSRVDYDKIFITATLLALFPMLTTEILYRRRNKKPLGQKASL